MVTNFLFHTINYAKMWIISTIGIGYISNKFHKFWWLCECRDKQEKYGSQWARWEVGQPNPELVDPPPAHLSPPCWSMQKKHTHDASRWFNISFYQWIQLCQVEVASRLKEVHLDQNMYPSLGRLDQSTDKGWTVDAAGAALGEPKRVRLTHLLHQTALDQVG